MPEPTRTTPPEEARLAIGVIVAPQGVRGQVRMQIWTQFPDRLSTLQTVYLGDEPEPRRLRAVRLKGGLAILTLEGVETRDAAEALRGTVVRVGPGQAAPLAEDEYYHYQLIGLQAVDEAGRPLGELTEIIETGANDVYVVRSPDGRETLLPALKDVILDIDIAQGRMVVRPLRYADE